MNASPRMIYPTILAFRLDGMIQNLISKQQLRNFIDSKPTLKEKLKGVLKDKTIPQIRHLYRGM